MTKIPTSNDLADARVSRLIAAEHGFADHKAKAAHMRMLMLLAGLSGLLALLGLLMAGLAWHKTTSVGFAIMGLGGRFAGYWAQACNVFGPAPRLKGIVTVSVGVSNAAGLMAFLLLFS